MSEYNNILAIDTATRSLKLALSFGRDRLVKSEQVVEKSHGRVIIKKISDLFESAAMSRTELEGIVVATGPGSFTGIRIGLAVAKGIAVALGIPVVGVTVFELAARHFETVPGPVTILIPFRRGEFFLGEVENGSYDLDGVEIVTAQQVAEISDSKQLVGVGFDVGSQISGNGSPVSIERVDFDASELLHLGIEKLNREMDHPLAELEPLYLQKSQAELRFERRHKQ